MLGLDKERRDIILNALPDGFMSRGHARELLEQAAERGGHSWLKDLVSRMSMLTRDMVTAGGIVSELNWLYADRA